MNEFDKIPENPIIYWLSNAMREAFDKGDRLGEVSAPRRGLDTGKDSEFIREWFEIGFSLASFSENKTCTENNKSRWYPLNKGGKFRRWSGNRQTVINWENNGEAISKYAASHPKGGTRIQGKPFYFKPLISWSNIGTGSPSFRFFPNGWIFGSTGPSLSANDEQSIAFLGFLNSTICYRFLDALAPGLHFEVGHMSSLPVIEADSAQVDPIVKELIEMFRRDWDDYETSWDFETNPLVAFHEGSIEKRAERRWIESIKSVERAQSLEETNNRYFAKLYELENEVEVEVPLSRISLTANPFFRYISPKGVTRAEDEYKALFFRDLAKELISYAVGCMMGRYSLDRPGLILADAGDTLEKFDQLVPDAGFSPDDDGILPITEGEYFTDDITARFRAFLAVAFGSDAVEATVAWIEEALATGTKKRKTIEDYFLNDFYDDHVQAYSSRPIYWQFSSPKKGFNALVYLHRYTPATIGLIHQNYAEEHLDKLQARLDTITHALPSADKRDAVQLGKERDTIAARIREIRSWVDDVLFRMSTERIVLDLDDGVKANYPKLAGAVKKVTRL
ncbi:BREX-1 system adenine-specific DNA-methyltransferase PglX [Rhodococcus erythropolis]|nr:BREX-1 system adenine-specific DNA-methyltransferase PglX [Rhodococcus erythropolis]